MRFFEKWALGSLAVCSAWCFAGEKDTAASEEKPAIELGGYVTVDYLSDMNDLSSPTLQIGEVDLGANVNISDEVVASVLIMTWNQLDSLWIDQALVSYTPQSLPIEFLFGQQTFNHGLLTTRLISDPLLLDAVELKNPGLIANGSHGMFTGGLGFTVLKLETEETDPENHYSAVVNVDAALPNESVLRLSSLANDAGADVDFAGIVAIKKLALDFEGFMTVKTGDSLKPAGFYAGASYDITDRFAFAVRADGLSKDNFSDLEMRYAGGITVSIQDGIFFAMELSRIEPSDKEPVNEIAIEVGLEQTIRLPGFQRKTLTKE